MDVSCDVIVVGAGLAGLVAANRLLDAGIDVQVVEARDRVGGKTWTVESHHTSIDIGGQWIGETQHHARDLARDLGLELFVSSTEHPLDRSGQFTVVLDGEAYRLPAIDLEQLATLPIPRATMAQLELASTELNALAGMIPAAEPWTAPDARRWDAMTLESWAMDRLSDPLARALFHAIGTNELAVSPVDISVLSMAHQMAMNPEDEVPELWRIVGGAQQMSDLLAERLGDRVRLADPVVAVERKDGGVIVYTDLDAVYRAKRTIIAMPPHLAGRLDYYPPMPVARESLTARFPVGHVIKVQAVYDRPFWREAGLNGYALIPITDTISFIGDNSTPESDKGVLVGFVYGDPAANMADLSPEERRRTLLQAFADVFGEQAQTPLDYIEGLWSREQWSLGAWQCMPITGAWTSYGPSWRAPIGPIHWAAAEYADRWYGYMDGAIASGRAAADEVRLAL